MAKTVGNLLEIQGEVVFEWELKDFFPLCEEKKKCLKSPKFYFSGTSWEFWICPNGDSDETEGWISLYLMRMSTGFPFTVDFALSIKTADGKTYKDKQSEQPFNEKHLGWRFSKLISKSDLLEKKSQFFATDDIKITCTLKNSERKNVAGSLFSRYQRVIDNLKEARIKGKRTDFIFKVEGQDIPAHRMILETGSPVFAAMFKHDAKESQTGEVSIDDVDNSTMNAIVLYIYSGEINALTTENAISLYAAAEKYDINDLREICLGFIMTNLSVEWICDVIKFADLYQLQELSDRSREFFKKNASKILKTEKWKTFSKENQDIGIEFLVSVVTSLLPE